METLYKTTSEKQEDGTWKEIRVPLSAEEQALREKEIAEYLEYEKNVLIPNQYKTDRVEGVYTLNDEGEVIDHAEKLIKYPSITDQLDMLWHSMDTGEISKSKIFYDINKSVKNKYPKE